ncbi:hypothetical protein ACIO02_35490 [Streptomyces sp. NPDC087568]|uniref:hypothetical protein n=1 Tax=Streptomyces sp. NPDC087568 TaxID=3365799 RepID=UPI00382F32C7
MGAVTDKITEEVRNLHGDETAPGLAQVAIALAQSIDEPGGPTGKSNAARELRQVMADLRKLAPVAEEGDTVDDIAAQRAKRRAAAREHAAGE